MNDAPGDERADPKTVAAVAATFALQPFELSAWLDHFPPEARPDPPTTPEG